MTAAPGPTNAIHIMPGGCRASEFRITAASTAPQRSMRPGCATDRTIDQGTPVFYASLTGINSAGVSSLRRASQPK